MPATQPPPCDHETRWPRPGRGGRGDVGAQGTGQRREGRRARTRAEDTRRHTAVKRPRQGASRSARPGPARSALTGLPGSSRGARTRDRSLGQRHASMVWTDVPPSLQLARGTRGPGAPTAHVQSGRHGGGKLGGPQAPHPQEALVPSDTLLCVTRRGPGRLLSLQSLSCRFLGGNKPCPLSRPGQVPAEAVASL